MFILLYGFITKIRESYFTKIYGREKIIIGKNEKLILIAYSAGVVPLFKFAFKNLKNVEKIILIAPAGTIHRRFFSHCLAFLKELKYFYSFDREKAKQILKESIATFCKHPIDSLIKIHKIKRFRLIKKIKEVKIHKIKLIKFYSSDDNFMFDIVTAPRNGDDIITKIASGHFAIIHNYKNYALRVKRAIED